VEPAEVCVVVGFPLDLSMGGKMEDQEEEWIRSGGS